jgi:CHASE1-domain containing sensor protein
MNHFAYLRILNIVLSFALAGASFYISYRHEQDQIFRRYTAEVNAIASSLELELGRNIALLMSFRSFYQAFPQVEKSGFAIFSQNARQFNNGVYGMRYVSRVLSEQRIEFETSATERNGAESFITYQTRDGTFTVAPESDEYFPVEYAEPAAKKQFADWL